ncbi:MAG: hypothetical protein KTR29_13490 [Rhodothermaceae bacterium]|nr:hypothetical protein [Rhodothermaceae bacterium]
MRPNTVFTLLLSVLLLAGCASTKKAAEHPLSGMWDYAVDTPEGVYNGVISITEAEGSLVGSITSDALSGTMDLTDLAFADNKLSFKFDSGQYGVLDLNVTVDGNSFNGAISVPGVGEMPVSGSRKMGDM